MVITSELIGKLGGGSEIESWDVSVEVPSAKTATLDTITVESGETKLLVLTGSFSMAINQYNQVYFQVGTGEKMAPYESRKILSTAEVLTSTKNVTLRNGYHAAVSFTGTFYLLDWEV